MFVLVLKLPLVTTDRKFEVFRVHSFPIQVSNGTFVRLKIQNVLLVVNEIYHTYITLTETELNQCTGSGNIRVFKADKSIRNRNTGRNACEFDLYKHANVLTSDCTRLVSVRTPDPELCRQGVTVFYYMPELTVIFSRCRKTQSWTASSIVLDGAGRLTNSEMRHITAGNVHLYAQLNGETRVRTNVPAVIAPSHQAMTSPSELNKLRDVTAEQATYKLLNTLSVHKVDPSVDDLLALHTVMTTHSNCMCWSSIKCVSFAIFISTVLVYHYTCMQWSRFCKKERSHRSTAEADGHTASEAATPVPQPRSGQASIPAPILPGAPSNSRDDISPQSQHAVYAIQ